MEAWLWDGRVYRWYLDRRLSYDGKSYRFGGRFSKPAQAKQLIVQSIASRAILELPAGGTVAHYSPHGTWKDPTNPDSRRDHLTEVSNNSRTKEEIEAEYAILSFHSDKTPAVISQEPMEDLERLGAWETAQENEPWYQWGGQQFLISYYAILDRYVSKGQQYRGFPIEGTMQPLLSTAYTEVTYRLSELDEVSVHTVGMFLAFLA